MEEYSIDTIDSSLQAIRRRLWRILAISLLAALLAYGTARHIPRVYEVHFSYMVSSSGEQRVQREYQYDGFYGLSAIDLFTTTLARIADSPEVVVRAYEAVALPVPTYDAISLTRAIDAEKVAPQLVRFTVSDAKREHAEALAMGLQQELDALLEQYNANNNSSPTFQRTVTRSWTSQRVIRAVPIAASSFVFVFFIGLITVLFRDALRRGVTS
jgi:hypothetical protein